MTVKAIKKIVVLVTLGSIGVVTLLYMYASIEERNERKAFQQYIEQQPYFNLLINKSVYNEDIGEASECYIGDGGAEVSCKEIHLSISRKHMTVVKGMLKNSEIKSDQRHIFSEDTYWYMYEPKENLQDWIRESGFEPDTESEEVSFSVLMHTKNWWERLW
jgi:hypothetical protein